MNSEVGDISPASFFYLFTDHRMFDKHNLLILLDLYRLMPSFIHSPLHLTFNAGRFSRWWVSFIFFPQFRQFIAIIAEICPADSGPMPWWNEIYPEDLY
jgi:hypothetical protein